MVLQQEIKTPLYEPEKVLYNRCNLKKGGIVLNCMKCGRDIEEGQVFCPACLEDMARYPVKPGIAIQLPPHKTGPAPKKPHTKRRQPPKPEEKILAMKKWMRFLLAMWLITLALLIAAMFPTVEYFLGNTFHLPGQNYSTITESSTANP